jgi:predicted aspartyl protease
METVDALVDTGSSYSMFSGAMLRRLGVFPRTMLERLGIRRLERVGFEQADGSIVELDVGVAWMTISGRERASSVAFGRDDSEALLGANALQEL